MGTIFHPAIALLRRYPEKYSDAHEEANLGTLVAAVDLTVQTRTT